MTHIVLNSEQKNSVAAIASGAQSLSKISSVLPANVGSEVRLITQQGFVFSFSWVLIICLGLALLAMLIAILSLKNVQNKTEKDTYILDI